MSYDDGRKAGGRAVVIGGSIAGLFAARVLAGRYAEVEILERDRLDGGGHRRGAAQGRHLHGLMDRGRQIMEELFPGLTSELAAQGVPTTEVLRGSRWYLSGLRVHPTDTGLITVLAGRPLLEATIRRRAGELTGVRLRDRTVAAGLAGSGRRITGVRLAESDETVPADLVVDATGHGSRATEWLSRLGLPAPAEERIDVDLGYSSRLYRRLPEHLDGDLGVVVSTMPGFRGGGAIAQEGDRWLVTLAGMLGDHPPTDPDRFQAFAATLPVPDVHSIVSVAEPLGDPVPHRFRGSRRLRYDLLDPPPAGFIAVGDAVASFNPLYAQGMTVAAQHALQLREWLDQDGIDSAALHRRIGRVVDVAWAMSTGSDLRYPGVIGRRGLRTRLTNAYLERVQVAAHTDPVVARALMRVANLADRPTTLLNPAMIARVLRRSGAANPQPPRPALVP